MGEPNPKSWWWLVRHGGHPAFYLRSLRPGDFNPAVNGGRFIANFVLGLDGALPDPSVPARCGTCNEEVLVADLDVEDRNDGTNAWLIPFRRGLRPWPKATPSNGCFLCISVRELEPVRTAKIAAYYGVGAAAPDATVRCCAQCASSMALRD